MGVADYQLANMLPKQLKGEMPTIEELETELEEEMEKLQKPIDKKRDKIKKLLKNLKQDEIKEKWSPESRINILRRVLMPLHNSITHELSNEILLFEDPEFSFGTEHMSFKSLAELEEHLQTPNQSKDLCLSLRLSGFKPAGTDTFNLYGELYFTMGEYKYIIGLGRNEQNPFLQKLYHQLPDQSELILIVDKFCESILESIEKNIERINLTK